MLDLLFLVLNGKITSTGFKFQVNRYYTNGSKEDEVTSKIESTRKRK